MKTTPPTPKKLCFLLFPVLALSLSLPAMAKEEAESRKERTCIHVSSINGFNPIDRKHLTISAGTRRTYLVTLFSNCHELPWTETVGISAHSSWTCTNSKDQLIVDGDRCIINRIERVENRAAAKELVAKRNPDRKRD